MTTLSTATPADCRPAAPPLRARPSPLPLWRLRLATAYIEANLGEPVRLEDVARAAGLTRMHFAAQFRAATGVRPHDYLLHRRIERAKVLLMLAETAIVEIALSVGFQNQAHFSTVFKRLTGDSPSIWRRRALDGMLDQWITPSQPQIGQARVIVGAPA